MNISCENQTLKSSHITIRISKILSQAPQPNIVSVAAYRVFFLQVLCMEIVKDKIEAQRTGQIRARRLFILSKEGSHIMIGITYWKLSS